MHGAGERMVHGAFASDVGSLANFRGHRRECRSWHGRTLRGQGACYTARSGQSAHYVVRSCGKQCPRRGGERSNHRSLCLKRGGNSLRTHGHSGCEVVWLPRGGGQSAQRSPRHAGGNDGLKHPFRRLLRSSSSQVRLFCWSLALCLVLCLKPFFEIASVTLDNQSAVHSQLLEAWKLGLVVLGAGELPLGASVVGGSLHLPRHGEFAELSVASVSCSHLSLVSVCSPFETSLDQFPLHCHNSLLDALGEDMFALRFLACRGISTFWLRSLPKTHRFWYRRGHTTRACLARHDCMGSYPREGFFGQPWAEDRQEARAW